MKISVPTTLSETSNAELRKLCKDKYGVILTIEQANEEAFRVMTFMAIVFENTDEYYD